MARVPNEVRRGTRLFRALIAGALSAVVVVSGGTAALGVANIDSQDGTDYYVAPGGIGWHYGPSFVKDSAGLHVYTCAKSPDAGQWDVISYAKSTDGGMSWVSEQTTLTGTLGTADNYSACDPSVINFGGYYYLAYTSTVDVRGMDNNVFVARSTSPTGPWAKWNGTGWGGNPAPIVTHDGPDFLYGAGEPSLVVVGDVLYVYYNWISADPTTGRLINQMRLAKGSALSANWPSTLSYAGVALDRRTDQAQDSNDVKWVPAWNKFITINSARRFGPDSFIQAWESDPTGLNFQPSNFDSSHLKRNLHNVGITGDSLGHFNPMIPNRVGYAYGSSWGRWNTSMDPITLTNDARPAAPQIYTQLAGNGSVRLEFQTDAKATSYTIKYGTTPGSYTSSVTGVTASPYTLTGLTNGTTYYIALTATGPTGTSDVGTPIAVTPQDWAPLPITSVQARSWTGSLTPAKAIDGDPSTFYSSADGSSSTTEQWLAVDLGYPRPVGRVSVVKRPTMPLAAPAFDSAQHAVVQTSLDGLTWNTMDTRLGASTVRESNGIYRDYLTFPRTVQARFVRIEATQLSVDDFGNPYLQVAEFGVEGTPALPIVSSYLTDLGRERLADGSSSTFWSSVQGTASTEQTAGISLGSAQSVSRLIVTPRASGYGFPVDFDLEYSNGAGQWSLIKQYRNYPNPGSAAQTLSFPTPVTAAFFRIRATKLGADDAGNHYLQLAEMQVEQSYPFTGSASSTANSAFVVNNGADQVNSTAWSSAGHLSASATEWYQVDLGAAKAFQDIYIDPNNQAFPSAFSLSSSNDGVTWTPLPGQKYVSYTDPAGAGTAIPPTQKFHLTYPVTARYIRVTATELRQDNYGYYYFQLRDIRVTG